MKIPPFFRTVRARLTLWNVLVLALVLLALGGTLRMTVAHSLMASVDSDIKGRARRAQNIAAMFARYAVQNGMQMPAESNGAGSRGSGRFPPFRLTRDTGAPSQWQTQVVEKMFNLKGVRIFGPAEDTPLDWNAFVQAAAGRETYTTVRIADERVRVFSAPLSGKGNIHSVVQEGYSLNDVDRAQGKLDWALLTLIPVGLVAAAAGGLLLTGWMLRPVRQVTQAAARIGAEDLSRRLPEGEGDEFSELAATFNGMLARLEASFEQQRRFTADASHELRTPLTVVKSAASRTLIREDLPDDYRKVMERIDRAAAVMGNVVQDLLLLARSDAGQLEIPLRPTRLSEILEVAVECVQPQGGAAISNRIENPDLWVQGDTSHLTRLFVNLLENAVRHTPADGKITLSAHQEGSTVIVTAEDTGIGIPPEHLPHVCERFYRVDDARSRAHGGTGLGLAICRSIVRAHQGRMDITSSPGIGTTVRVTLCHAAPLAV